LGRDVFQNCGEKAVNVISCGRCHRKSTALCGDERLHRDAKIGLRARAAVAGLRSGPSRRMADIEITLVIAGALVDTPASYGARHVRPTSPARRDR